MKEKFCLKSIFQNKTAQNGIWLYVLQLFNAVAPLITLPYITRILGVTEYGIFTIAINFVGYFQTVVEYGFGMSGTRKASLAHGKKDLQKTFSEITFARIFLYLVCIVPLLCILLLFDYSIKQIICILLLFLIPIGVILQHTWLFQGLQRMKYIALANVVSRIISLICIFVFVREKTDLYLYCALYSGSSILIGIIGSIFAGFELKINYVRISFSDIIHELRDGWYVFTTSLSSKIFTAFGITILGFYVTTYEVGIFSVIQKIPLLIMFAWSPISQVLYPVSSQRMTLSFVDGQSFVRKVRVIIFPIFLIGCTIVALSGEWILNYIFGIEFGAYSYLLYPLLIWLVVSIYNNFSGIQILLAGGYSKQYSKCFNISVVITIMLNIILVKMFGLIGGAVAPAISEIVLGLLLANEIKKLNIIHSTIGTGKCV